MCIICTNLRVSIWGSFTLWLRSRVRACEQQKKQSMCSYSWPLQNALTFPPPILQSSPIFMPSLPPDSLLQLFLLWEHTLSSPASLGAGDPRSDLTEWLLSCVDVTHTRVSILGACQSACPLLVICPSFLSLLAHLSLPGSLWVFFLYLSPWDCVQPHLLMGSVSSMRPRAAAINMPFTVSWITDKNVKWVRSWHGHLQCTDICHYHKCMAFEGRNQALSS